MVKDLFRGFGYTLGKILAFIFLGFLVAFLISKIDINDVDIKKIPFQQLIMKTLFVNAHALSVERPATVGREQFMYTDSSYFNTGWQNLSSNNINYKPIMSASSPFYMMGTEYVVALDWIGDTSCTGSVEVPVVAGDFTSFTNTDGLNSADFKLGIHGNFGVYNLSPTINSFTHFCNNVAGSPSGFSRLYCDYTINFSINNLSIANGATNLNFAVYNTSANRSAYYIPLTVSSNFAAYFPSLTSSSGTFPSMAPRVSLNCTGSSSVDTSTIENNQTTIINQNNEIIDGIDNVNDNINNASEDIVNAQNGTTNAIYDFLDSMNDESQPDTEGMLDEIGNLQPSDTPITDLINMPYNLVNKFYNGFGSSCSSINLGSLYGTNLIMPCINLQQILGSNLWGIIDALFSIFMLLNIGELLIHDFTSLTTLNDLFDETYTPKHIYKPKHGGGN